MCPTVVLSCSRRFQCFSQDVLLRCRCLNDILLTSCLYYTILICRTNVQQPPDAPYIPSPKGRGFTAHLIKWIVIVGVDLSQYIWPYTSEKFLSFPLYAGICNSGSSFQAIRVPPSCGVQRMRRRFFFDRAAAVCKNSLVSTWPVGITGKPCFWPSIELGVNYSRIISFNALKFFI